ncbi:MAG: hypothetical protein IKF01_02210 [Bacilli bacterium]|nr:hypothetical protein [Bacilli bacterium]
MEQKKTPTWLVVLCVIIGIFILGTVIISVGDNDKNNGNENNTTTINSTDITNDSKNQKTSDYSLDKSFKFDDLEITIGSQIEFVKNTNEFSDEYDKDVIKIPITVKNLKNETHSLNMFYIKVFGSQGTEVKNQFAYFDDSIQSGGELRPDASYTKYLYYTYDGDGKYTIELDNFAKKIDIDLNIAK